MGRLDALYCGYTHVNCHNRRNIRQVYALVFFDHEYKKQKHNGSIQSKSRCCYISSSCVCIYLNSLLLSSVRTLTRSSISMHTMFPCLTRISMKTTSHLLEPFSQETFTTEIYRWLSHWIPGNTVAFDAEDTFPEWLANGPKLQTPCQSSLRCIKTQIKADN